jgi:hypothetical protein
LALNLAVLGIADSGTRAGTLVLDPSGVAVRAHTAPCGKSFGFHSLHSLMGPNMKGEQQKSGSGATLIWDSR